MTIPGRLLRQGTILRCCGLLFLLTLSALAQSPQGALVGTVTDTNGARIASATVTVQAVGSSLKRVAATNSAGEYRIESLPPADYRVTVSATNFLLVTYVVKLTVNSSPTIPIVLKPAAVSATVQASDTGTSSSSQPLETTSSVQKTLIAKKDLANVPLAHRSFANIAYLAPMTQPVEPSDPTKARITTAPAPQATPTPQLPVIHVEVIATRLPEDPQEVPSAVEVFNGDELRNRGYHDLRSALTFATGVEVAPGGDAGPASAVPDFWGLKEFDAFLLVVDGVPWGGSFNPALTTLDMNDIERIEVMRGPAPVTYGATSFVGVIHVVHKDTAAKEKSLTVRGGSYGTFGSQFATPIPLSGKWSSRLSLDAQCEGFRDDRTNYRRGHGLWRVERKGNGGNRAWFNFDMNWLNQDPASPRVRDGKTLTPLVPVDANNNPKGSFLNDRRFTGAAGFDRRVGSGTWSGTVSFSHSRQSALRGFLEDITAPTDNAHGFRQNIHLTDIYADTHASWKVARSLTLLIGTDFLHGTGNSRGADFEYTVALNGVPPVTVAVPSPLDVTTRDTRNFFGGYTSIEWRPVDRLRVDAGIRLNITHETQKHDDPGAGTSDSDRRTKVRPGGSLGFIVTAWKRNQDSVNLYANYRDTFKPAAIDFGTETFNNRLILEPETSRSVEGGMKARFFDRRVEVEASGFLMDFKNLVTPISVGGLPALTNAGTQRFKGFESGVSLFMTHDITAKATYSYHDARFTNYVQDFGGVPTQLAGKRLEMSAHNLAAFGIFYAPERGFLGGANVYYTGARFLNKRNTAPANGFATIGFSAGYRTPKWELRVDATNVGNRRDPVAESELGDAQYYLMTPRRVVGGFTFHF